jgi:hypothetical protein
MANLRSRLFSRCRARAALSLAGHFIAHADGNDN